MPLLSSSEKVLGVRSLVMNVMMIMTIGLWRSCLWLQECSV